MGETTSSLWLTMSERSESMLTLSGTLPTQDNRADLASRGGPVTEEN